MRSAECGIGGQGRSLLDAHAYMPHSKFRIPRWGGAFGRTSDLRNALRALFHAGWPPARGGGGLVRVPRLRAARGALPGKISRPRRRDAVPRRARGAIALLP